MRKLAALFMALAVSAPAQTRTGVTAAPGLGGTPLAPVPGVSLSPAALAPGVLPAAALTPSLGAIASAPAPAVPAQAAAAKADAPAARAVQAVHLPAALTPVALAAIKPAASNPDDSASAERAAAANALFDGAARRPAASAGDGPAVPGSRSDPNRSSGLSPPSDREIGAAWREARPKSKAMETFGSDFVGVAAEIAQKYTFMGEHLLGQMDPRGGGVMDFHGRAVYRSAAELVEAHDDRSSPAAVRFMKLLGSWMAFKDSAREERNALQTKLAKAAGMRVRGHRPHLPPSPIEGGEYWDMAAGMNALGFIHNELDPKTNYSFFDYSPYVASYLETAARIAGKSNAKVVEGDIGALSKPAKPVAVLRTKNAVYYVPGFDKKLEQMADWIAEGGQLVIQNDPNPGQRALILERHGPVIRRLLAEGWGIEFGFSGVPGSFADYALDTLILTRPKGPAAPRGAAAVAQQWSGYQAAVRRVDAEYNPFLAMLFGR